MFEFRTRLTISSPTIESGTSRPTGVKELRLPTAIREDEIRRLSSESKEVEQGLAPRWVPRRPFSFRR